MLNHKKCNKGNSSVGSRTRSKAQGRSRGSGRDREGGRDRPRHIGYVKSVRRNLSVVKKSLTISEGFMRIEAGNLLQCHNCAVSFKINVPEMTVDSSISNRVFGRKTCP